MTFTPPAYQPSHTRTHTLRRTPFLTYTKNKSNKTADLCFALVGRIIMEQKKTGEWEQARIEVSKWASESTTSPNSTLCCTCCENWLPLFPPIEKPEIQRNVSMHAVPPGMHCVALQTLALTISARKSKREQKITHQNSCGSRNFPPLSLHSNQMVEIL